MPEHSSTENPIRYGGFISHHTDSQRKLAEDIAETVAKIGKPWYRSRSCKLFVAHHYLRPGEALPEALKKALAGSKRFILLASPDSARSEWITKELEHWATFDREPPILVLCSGDIRWSDSQGDFDWEATTALPKCLSGKFHHEPLFIDLRSLLSAGGQTELRANSFFDVAMTSLAAGILDRDPVELSKHRVLERRKARFAATAVIAVALTLVVGSAWLWHRRQVAEESRLATKRAVCFVQYTESRFLSDLGKLISRCSEQQDDACEMAKDQLRVHQGVTGSLVNTEIHGPFLQKALQDCMRLQPVSHTR